MSCKVVLHSSVPRRYLGWMNEDKSNAVEFEAYGMAQAMAFYINGFSDEYIADIVYDITVGVGYWRCWFEDSFCTIEDVT